jgi:hypothetical protein
MSDTIELISPHNGLVVTLRPPDIDWNPQTGARVVKPGVKVRFQNGRAKVTPEEWALMQDAKVYTGEGGRKRVWLADEMLSTTPGTKVVQGALGTAPTSVPLKPPTDEWDTTGAVALAKQITSGELKVDFESAWHYEMDKSRRKAVIRALTDAMLDGPAPSEPEPVATPAMVSLPDDIEGV